MTLFVGQHVWVHFPGNRVEAVIADLGVGEAKILESGSAKAEWVPLSWVESKDDESDDSEALWADEEDRDTQDEDDLLPGFGEYAQFWDQE